MKKKESRESKKISYVKKNFKVFEIFHFQIVHIQDPKIWYWKNEIFKLIYVKKKCTFWKSHVPPLWPVNYIGSELSYFMVIVFMDNYLSILFVIIDIND